MTRLLIVTEHLPPAFHFALQAPQRGTEKFYRYTAVAARELGFDQVDVEMDGAWGDEVAPGVFAVPRAAARPFYDQILVCNPREVDLSIGRSYTANVRVWHDFHYGDQSEGYDDLQAIADHFGSKLYVISNYSRSLHRDPRRVVVAPLGIDRSIYYPPDGPPGPRRKLVAFTSSPDRGLEPLRQLWEDDAFEQRYGYHLVSTAYAAGRFTDQDVAELLRQAAFWIHPGIGNELFCLAAVEAQACGATPLVVPTGALAETVRYGYCFTQESFVNGLEGVLSRDAVLQGVNADHINDWRTATERLLFH